MCKPQAAPLRAGRDDKRRDDSSEREAVPVQQLLSRMNRRSLCHLDRSAAQWRDLRFQRSFPGNVFPQLHTLLSPATNI